MNKNNESLDDFLAKQNLEEEKSFWIVNQKKIAYVLKKTKKYHQNINTFCDIGIGNAYTLKFFYKRGVQSTGIDISSFLINYHKQQFSKENLDINLLEADITKVHSGKNIFDFITCFDVLEHLPGEGINTALVNISNSLNPNGILVGTVPLRENLELAKVICPECRTKFHPIGHHHSFQRFDDIRNLLTSNFEIIKFGEVPVVFTRILIFYGLGNWMFKLARRLILNQRVSTAFFVARKKTDK